MMFTSDPKKMGIFVNPLWMKVVGYLVCFAIAFLNIYLLYTTIGPFWVGITAPSCWPLPPGSVRLPGETALTTRLRLRVVRFIPLCAQRKARISESGPR